MIVNFAIMELHQKCIWNRICTGSMCHSGITRVESVNPRTSQSFTLRATCTGNMCGSDLNMNSLEMICNVFKCLGALHGCMSQMLMVQASVGDWGSVSSTLRLSFPSRPERNTDGLWLPSWCLLLIQETGAFFFLTQETVSVLVGILSTHGTLVGKKHYNGTNFHQRPSLHSTIFQIMWFMYILIFIGLSYNAHPVERHTHQKALLKGNTQKWQTLKIAIGLRM